MTDAQRGARERQRLATKNQQQETDSVRIWIPRSTHEYISKLASQQGWTIQATTERLLSYGLDASW